MNSWQFYSKLQQYKDKSTLSHASIPASYKKLATGLNNMKNYGYYNKIDNFYGPGKSRYFYSKDEWDAYQREKNKMYDKAKADVRKKNEEQIQKEIDKYSNVNAAQNARAKEEKKGTYAIREQYVKKIDDKFDASRDVYKDILDIVGKAGKNTSGWIKSTLQNNLPEGYHVNSNGNISINLEEAHPDIAKRMKETYIKEARLDFGVDDPKNESIKNYKERKTDIEYERAKILDELNEIYYKNIEHALHKLIDNNNKQSANNIKNALWEAVNEENFNYLRGKIYDPLFSFVKYYGFKRPNSGNTQTWDNAETWDNSKNIKSWDSGTTLYEDVLKENVIKEATVKPIEVKPIEVKKIKIK